MNQPSRLRSIGRKFADLYSDERALFGLGLLGILLGIIGLIVMAVYGRIIPPEGYLYKAASFDIAIGIYILTITLFIPLAGFSAGGRRLWRRVSVALTLYAYAIENIQIYRGLDPRFTRFGTSADKIAGLIFGLVALGLITIFLVLTVRFFSRRNAVGDELLLIAIRYGCAAAILAFGVGIWMSVNQGAVVGHDGSLLPLHAAGFHGLQAVPLVALLFGWARVPTEEARRWIHVAGLSWLGACVAIAWQTARGHSVLEISTATVLACAMLLGWLLCAVTASLAWRRKEALEYSA